MRKTNTLIFLSIALKQIIARPRSSGTPFPVFIYFWGGESICRVIFKIVCFLHVKIQNGRRPE